MKGIRTILIIEAVGFVIVMLAVWFNEIFDIPYYLLGVPPEKFNYHEAIFESVFVLLLAGIIVIITRNLMERIAQLKSISTKRPAPNFHTAFAPNARKNIMANM